MVNEFETLLKQEVHSMNNWLNKITILSGQARYELETNGFTVEKLEEEKQKFIKLLNDVEESALKVGEVLRNLRKMVDGAKR